jgi:hypothetical protein
VYAEIYSRSSIIDKIYFSFIPQVLGYMYSDNCTEREPDLLKNVQVSAAQIITGMRINSSRSTLYDEFG